MHSPSAKGDVTHGAPPSFGPGEFSQLLESTGDPSLLYVVSVLVVV